MSDWTLVERIVSLLENHESLTASELAEIMDVSESAIDSTLDLICLLGLPLEAAYGGGYSLPMGFEYPCRIIND